MILIVDNYDSFTYNLVQYFGEVTESSIPIEVHRNDEISVAEIAQRRPSHIVISPGPCTPNEAGVSVELVRELQGRFPILGVCLGHQAIAQAFGGKIVRARDVFHGKTSRIMHSGKGIFDGLENHFRATRYHSLVVDPELVPKSLEVNARSSEGEIMGLHHREYREIIGLQFHPESILTELGKTLLRRFLTFEPSKKTPH